jgi:hypothetical protein
MWNGMVCQSGFAAWDLVAGSNNGYCVNITSVNFNGAAITAPYPCNA